MARGSVKTRLDRVLMQGLRPEVQGEKAPGRWLERSRCGGRPPAFTPPANMPYIRKGGPYIRKGPGTTVPNPRPNYSNPALQ